MSKKKSLRPVFFLLGALLFVILIGKAVKMVQSSVWGGSHHLNLAIDNGDVEIWSIEPSKKTIFLVIIPKDMMLTLPRYGNYKAGNVGKLSLLERKDGELLKEGLEQTFAIPIDAIVLLKSDARERFPPQDFFGLGAFSQTIAKRHMVRSFITNLSPYDVFRLWLLSFSLIAESIEKLDLAEVDASTKITLPDGGEVLTIDRTRFSKQAAHYFNDSAIEKEHSTIEILNGTDIQGKATSLSLLLTNIGGNVISTGKSEKQENKSWVFAKTKNYTASKIAQITDASFSNSPHKESRADILVLLGGGK